VCGVGVRPASAPVFIGSRLFHVKHFLEVLVMLCFPSSPRIAGFVPFVFGFCVRRLSRLLSPFGVFVVSCVFVGQSSWWASFGCRARCVSFPLLPFAGRSRRLVLAASFCPPSLSGLGSVRFWFWPSVLVLSVLCVAVSSVAFPAWVVSWVCVVVAGAVALSL